MEERGSCIRNILVGLFVTVIGGIIVVNYEKCNTRPISDNGTKEGKGIPEKTNTISYFPTKEEQKGDQPARVEVRPDIRGNKAPTPDAQNRVNEEKSEQEPQKSENTSSFGKVSKSGSLTFKLINCIQKEQFITCNCQVISDEKDVDLSIYGKNNTRIFDGKTGIEYYPSSIKIGGKSGGGAYYGTKKTVVAGYSTEIILEFQDIKNVVTSISKLELTINQAHTGTGTNKIEFRNIKVQINNGDVREAEPSIKAPKLTAITKAKSGELTFNYNKCKQFGDIVTCTCTVESEDRDVDLSIYGKDNTRILDGKSGKEFYPSIIKIGGKTGGGAYYGTKKTIVQGYSTEIIFEFQNVNVPIDVISKLQMTINRAHTGTGTNNVEFRNISMN